MYCTNCKKEIADSSLVCPYCGAPVRRTKVRKKVQRPKRALLPKFAAITAIALALSTVGCGGSSAGASAGGSETTQGDDSATVATQGEDSTTASEATEDSYNEGSYVVGKDIPAGEYKVIPVEESSNNWGLGCWFSVHADETENEFIGGDAFDTCSYVTVEDGQSIGLYGCAAIPVASCKPTKDLYQVNLYKVGVDIPAGTTIVLTPNSTDYEAAYEILESSLPGLESPIDSGRFDGETEITLKEGQYFRFYFADAKIK